MPSAEQIVSWLEKQGALQLETEGEEPPKPLSDDEEVHPIDLKRLFPEVGAGRDGNDWDLYGDDWQIPMDDDGEFSELGRHVQEILGRGKPSDEEGKKITGKLHWDKCAWYQPMHFFGNDWGIFIRRNCIIENAVLISQFLPPTSPSPRLLKALVRASFAALFLHEQFHHKVESLGIRLHVVEQVSRYLPYKLKVYRPTWGTVSNLEEALANADAYLRATTDPYKRWMGSTVLAALQEYLRWRYPLDPPGYNQAVHYLRNDAFDGALDVLHGQVQAASLTLARPAEDWAVASRLHQSLFKVNDHLWEVAPKGKMPWLPTRANPYPSISTRTLVKLAEQQQWQIKPGAGKGSHIRMEKPGHSPITIPANRNDLSPGVLKTTLATLGGFKLRDLPDLLHRRGTAGALLAKG